VKQPFDRARESRLLFVSAKGFGQAVDFNDGHGKSHGLMEH
jgi:hypothetical protein